MSRTLADHTTGRMRHRWLPACSIALALSSSAIAPGDTGASPIAGTRLLDPIAVNDNRVSAGRLQNGVLTLRLDARVGEWHPDGDADVGITVRAFGEDGKPLQVPGPLIRVPKGTEIHAFVRNSLDSTLYVHGLYTRGAPGGDTVQIAPGSVREVRFNAGAPGTYYYWATTSPTATLGSRGMDSQLHGAFVVDAGAALGTPGDRIFVLGLWSRGTITGVIERDTRLRFVINGKAWPNTERLAYSVGDTVRFRLVNLSAAPHPMHLHGFYFKVATRGNERTDTTYDASSPRWAVTERAAPGRTFSLTWVPERPGNWMFHCHDNFHVLRNQPLDGTPLPPEQHMAHVKNHALEMMGGLVMGIEVRPKGTAATRPDDRARRKLRLIARVDSATTDSEPAYGYVLQDGKTVTPSRSPLLPAPTIVLKRGEPVSITVVNELSEPTAVHWHGIELESYFDGVAGFSGTAARTSPAIAPRDSFAAHFTPPRSGTFIYHPHADEERQQRAGLAGAIVVLDDPATFAPATDIVLLVSTPRRAADAGTTVFLNGTSSPVPIEMKVGQRYRLRLINIHTFRPSMIARLGRDSALLAWRAIAKDGMDLAPDQATTRPAIQQMGNGETFDFEVVPSTPGDLRFWITTGTNVLLVSLPIRVH